MELYRLVKLASGSTPLNSPLRSGKMESVCSISWSVQPKRANADVAMSIGRSFIAFIEIIFLKSCANTQSYGPCPGECGVIDSQGGDVVQGLGNVHLRIEPGIIGDDEQVLPDQGQAQVLYGPVPANRYVIAQGSVLQPQKVSFLQEPGRNVRGIRVGFPIGQHIPGDVLAHAHDSRCKVGVLGVVVHPEPILSGQESIE